METVIFIAFGIILAALLCSYENYKSSRKFYPVDVFDIGMSLLGWLTVIFWVFAKLDSIKNEHNN